MKPEVFRLSIALLGFAFLLGSSGQMLLPRSAEAAIAAHPTALHQLAVADEEESGSDDSGSDDSGSEGGEQEDDSD